MAVVLMAAAGTSRLQPVEQSWEEPFEGEKQVGERRDQDHAAIAFDPANRFRSDFLRSRAQPSWWRFERVLAFAHHAAIE